LNIKFEARAARSIIILLEPELELQWVAAPALTIQAPTALDSNLMLNLSAMATLLYGNHKR
jgi:hypothetical protein